MLECSGHTDIWRAAVDNDGLKLRTDGKREKPVSEWAQPLFHWLYAGYDIMQRSVDACKVRAATDSVVISWRERSWGTVQSKIIKTQHQLEITADGSLHFEHAFQVDKGLYELPRLGVKFQLPAGLEQIEWYGLGPVENYSDRQTCARIGRWQSTVTEQYVPYIMPRNTGILLICVNYMFVIKTVTGLRLRHKHIVRLMSVITAIRPCGRPVIPLTSRPMRIVICTSMPHIADLVPDLVVHRHLNSTGSDPVRID
jgi:hypothetical protein